MEKYNHKTIEAKWQEYWEKHPELYAAENNSEKEKKYILDMWPYPSGDGLHVGHVESYTATDIISRYSRMKGMNVLHPQGWDAFGLPAENFAIKTKVHPLETTKKAIETFRGQMNRMGFSYDWSREACSADPEYYKWTQWFFLLLYKNGLAYKRKAKVNWCDSCQTVLANEQAEGGICERCQNQVIQKDMEQWFFKITDFVENKNNTSGLIDGLEKIDWPESTKLAQKNWIGKSEGAEFKLPVILNGAERNEESRETKVGNNKMGSFADAQDDKYYLEVFTTRLDTVFGMTFALIAPEHKLIQELKSQITNWDEVEKYIIEAKKKSELQRMTEVKEKTGVELKGIKVINPFTKEEIPLFASDFVLAHYGTGAVMAVPAHDERDFEFARKYNLLISDVVMPIFGEVHDNEIIRNTISPFIKRKSDGKLLLLKMKGVHKGIITTIIGGIESGESLAEAAERETLEETGYKTKFVKTLGEKLESHFYQSQKKEWRMRIDQPVLLELIDENPVQEVADHEKKLQEVVWLTEEEAYKELSYETDIIRLNRFLEKNTAYVNDGRLINSGEYNGLTSEEARKKLTEWLEKEGIGHGTINYKLRDWLVSRQRYWGAPIPMIYCDKCAQQKEQVLFLHGWEDDSKSGIIPELKKNLEQKGYEFFAFDAPNTDAPDFDEWFSFIEKKIKENNLKNFHLIGHSMGGHLAAKIAEKYKVKKLYLFAPVGFNASQNYFKQFEEKFGNEELEIFKKYQKRTLDVAKVKNNAEEIYMIFGEKDPWITEEIRNFYIENFKDKAQIHILEGYGHMSKDEGVTKLPFFENLFESSDPGMIPVPEKDLPVILPDDVDFMPTGESPLVKSKKFHDVKCPICGAKARRESDTMDTFVCSSWYYLRYSDPKNDKEFASKEMLKKWLSVDVYVGGAEHSVLHLLYSRFFTKVLHNLGYIDFDEPFQKLRHQGIILAEDSRKMSKSLGNVVNPDKVVDEYGADALRMFEMFMGPLEAMKPWNTKGIVGIVRFLEKVWKLSHNVIASSDLLERGGLNKKIAMSFANRQTPRNDINILLNKTIKKVTGDIENFRFNTAISQLMILVNAMEEEKDISLSQISALCLLLSPFAPHITEELWEKLGHKESIFKEKWPEADEKYLKDEEIEMVVQINGKIRGKFMVASDIAEEDAKKIALDDANIQKWLSGKEPKKIIFIKGKLLSIVV